MDNIKNAKPTRNGNLVTFHSPDVIGYQSLSSNMANGDFVSQVTLDSFSCIINSMACSYQHPDQKVVTGRSSIRFILKSMIFPGQSHVLASVCMKDVEVS